MKQPSLTNILARLALACALVITLMHSSLHAEQNVGEPRTGPAETAAVAIANANATAGQTLPAAMADSAGEQSLDAGVSNISNAAGTADNEHKFFEFELELDTYYSSFDVFLNLADTPIPEVGEKPEYEIYKDLIKSVLRPRVIALELSVNPMPALGVFIKKNMREQYSDAEFGRDFNLVKAITAGFEEPYAISLFLGNVVKFKKPGQDKNRVGNMGWVGYLFSHGDYHIKDNSLIYDKWYEFEWKIKGDRIFPESKLSWSFRIGAKYHDHPEINDVVYISLRRSRLEFNDSAFSIMRNSAFEYTFDMDSEDMSAVQHKFFVEKKFPNKDIKSAFTLALGFIWDSGRKYSGSLAPDGAQESYQIILRPNLEF